MEYRETKSETTGTPTGSPICSRLPRIKPQYSLPELDVFGAWAILVLDKSTFLLRISSDFLVNKRSHPPTISCPPPLPLPSPLPTSPRHEHESARSAHDLPRTGASRAYSSCPLSWTEHYAVNLESKSTSSSPFECLPLPAPPRFTWMLSILSRCHGHI